jgi:Ricin-type beta-trefoil lectin domain
MRPNGRGRLWRSLLATAGLTATVVAGTGSQQSAQAYATPVTRTDLINALAGISGSHTLSGIFQNPQTPNQWTQKYHDITGSYPGLWGSDFLYDAPTVAARQNIVDQGRIEWANGSVIALSFHTCPPTTGRTCDWTKDIEGHLTLAEVGQTPTPATLAAQPRWAYWMMWSHYLTDPTWNTDAGVQASAWDGRTDNQGQLGLGGPPGGGSPTGPVTGLAPQQSWTAGSDGALRTLGKCLDVAGGGTADGTKVQLWDCGAGNAHQQWTYQSRTRRLVNPATGKCLDVTGQNSADGTRLQIWTCNGQTNQHWALPS